MKKTLVLATVIAVLAGAWTTLVMNVKPIGDIPIVLWPTFIAWGAFFYAGATVDGLVKGLVQFATGIVLAAAATYLYLHVGTVAKDDSSFIILGIVVFLLAWPITALSGVSALRGLWAAVPTGFMGAGVFFGIFFFGNAGAQGPNPSEAVCAVATFIPLVCGEILGWLSLQITNLLAADRPAAGAAHA